MEFEFQPNGVLVNGRTYPIVKMEWASGSTLGEFVEGSYRDGRKLSQLDVSLHALAAYMEGQSLAHGDVQPGNVMVSRGGQSLQLIDYDGMFVDALKSLGSAELGHRNFQHPQRAARSWDGTLDRFSFIALNVAVRALQVRPDMWDKTQSDGDAFLFKANDFAEPAKSPVFAELFGHAQLSGAARNLAAICQGPFGAVPTLEDFLAGKNIPQVAIFAPPKPPASAGYMSAFPVLDAVDYALCLTHVGDRIELVGRIVEFRQDLTRHGKPYVFLNFAPWKGEIVKISIWSDGLGELKQRPDESWVGKWISVTGLLEPPFRSAKHHYSHLAVSITQANQLHFISKAEGRYRLAAAGARPPDGSAGGSKNLEILEDMQGGKPSSSSGPVLSPPKRPPTKNEGVLEDMIGSVPTPTKVDQRRPVPSPAATPGGHGCLSVIAIVVVLSIVVAVMCK